MLPRVGRIFWLALCAGLIVAHVVIGPLQWTGDEPRYTYQALGVIADHRLYPSAQLWNAFLQTNHLHSAYFGALMRPYQTLATAVAFGPALVLFGLEAARWICLTVGCAGLWFLIGALRAESPTAKAWPSWAAVAIVAFSPPFLAYLRLLYPEMLLLLLVSAALYALCTKRWYFGAVAIALMPFVHIRALPLSLAFAAVFAIQTRRENVTARMRLIAAAIYGSGLIAFIAFQLILSGSIGGFAFPEYQPNVAQFAERLAMQLFGVRHGLLLYAPLAIAGIAGLVSGAVQRRPLQTYALALLTAYLATFMWSEAGESWSGRFWVAALPFIAIGIDYFLRNTRELFAWIALSVLGALAAYNTALFISQPAFFLENRQAAIPYFILSTVLPVHLGLLLPIDAYPTGIPAYTTPVPYVLAWLSLLLAALTLAVAGNERARRAAAIASLACILIPIAVAIATPLPSSAFIMSTEPSNGTLQFRLNDGAHPWAIEFMDKTSLAWREGPYPREFRISCRKGATVLSASITPSRPMLTLPGCSEADRIDIDGLPSGEGRPFLLAPGLTTILSRPLR